MQETCKEGRGFSRLHVRGLSPWGGRREPGPQSQFPKRQYPTGTEPEVQSRPGSPRRCGCRSDRTQSWGRTQTRGGLPPPPTAATASVCPPRSPPERTAAPRGSTGTGLRGQGSSPTPRGRAHRPRPECGAGAASPGGRGPLRRLLTLTWLRSSSTTSPAHLDALVPPSGGRP